MTAVASPPRTNDRGILHRTCGSSYGPITRLVSPGDLGEALKPFI